MEGPGFRWYGIVFQHIGRDRVSYSSKYAEGVSEYEATLCKHGCQPRTFVRRIFKGDTIREVKNGVKQYVKELESFNSEMLSIKDEARARDRSSRI